MKWFVPIPSTLEELKKQYKRLALKHHPDRGGTTADMQEINSEYDQLFERLKTIHCTVGGDTYTATIDEKAADFRDIINRLIVLDGIKIEICGSWLWISGDTFRHKATLKDCGFRWAHSKKAWYYHGGEYKKKSKKTLTLDEIRTLYGSETIKGDPALRLKIV